MLSTCFKAVFRNDLAETKLVRHACRGSQYHKHFLFREHSVDIFMVSKLSRTENNPKKRAKYTTDNPN